MWNKLKEQGEKLITLAVVAYYVVGAIIVLLFTTTKEERDGAKRS